MEERTRVAAREREAHASRIDPKTCLRWFEWVNVLDPYGDGADSDRETCIGRWYFVSDPDQSGPAVDEHHVRLLHLDIPVPEWDALMRAAERRWYDQHPKIKEMQQRLVDKYPAARSFGWPFAPDCTSPTPTAR